MPERHHHSGRSSRRVRRRLSESVDTVTTEEYLANISQDAPLFDGEVPALEGEPEEPRKRRRKKKAIWFARHKAATALLAILLVLTLTGAAGLWWMVSALRGLERFGDPFASLQQRAPHAQTDASHEPVTFLFLGSDSRTSAGDPSQWEAGAQRTDAIMIVQLSGDRKNVNVMSIPRDSWVTIPANAVVPHESQAKINAAYSWGGPSLLIQVVEDITHIHIDHFAIADFESFEKLTDELGGVEITLTQPLDLTGAQKASTSSDVLEPGTHLLTGHQARIYTQERYTVANGDFDRIKRQQNWLRAMLKAAVSRDTLSDPFKLRSLISTVSSTLAVDDGLTDSTMLELGSEARDIRAADVNFFQAPVLGTSTSPDGQSIVLLDLPAFEQVCRAFSTDTVTQYVAEHRDELNMLGANVN